MDLQAIVFDVDGVLAETERDIHRIAFNRAFADAELDFEWDDELYGRLLQVSGGKERMKAYFKEEGWTPPRELDAYVRELHAIKREHFESILEGGEVSPRPGVKRLILEAVDRDVPVGIASTAHPTSIKQLVQHVLGEGFLHHFEFILGGDIVEHKKPAPAIYELALEKLGVSAERCVVIEDSENGLTAAKKAGTTGVVTPSFYTFDEDFSQADMVVSSLGDPHGAKAEAIDVPSGLPDFDYVTVDLLDELVALRLE